MLKIFSKLFKNKNDEIKQDDLVNGLEFFNYLISKNVSPLSLIGDGYLKDKYLEEFKNERIG